jgi:hypothetical protein
VVTLRANGESRGEVTLVEDPLVGLLDYCENADLNRLWAGRIQVSELAP